MFEFFLRQSRYLDLLEHVTTKLIKEKSVAHLDTSNNLKYVDIVRNVINLVPVYFVSTELLGVPLKTVQTPFGLVRDVECASLFAEACK